MEVSDKTLETSVNSGHAKNEDSTVSLSSPRVIGEAVGKDFDECTCTRHVGCRYVYAGKVHVGIQYSRHNNVEVEQDTDTGRQVAMAAR